MFTGIIETTGIITDVIGQGTNRTFKVSSPISGQLAIDQSLSHNGVCLTVEALQEGCHQVTAIEETLKKTALADWVAGTVVNLERCLAANGRLDGHFVQGHVDTTGRVTQIKDLDGSWEYQIAYPPAFCDLVIEKGSISLNGISLTVFDTHPGSFRVAIIPYTYHHTNINTLRTGDTLNLEFDLLGKYIVSGLKNLEHFKKITDGLS